MSTIQNNSVVSFHYTLTNAAGDILDKSEGDPLVYLHGAHNIVPGLEKEMAGKAVGDKFKTTVEAEEAYGEYQADLVQEVPRNLFQGVDDIQVGMQFQAQTDDGLQIVTVKDVTPELVVVDANHPLAGQALTFDVEVVGIRPASEEELEHGHAHGAGGHHH